MKQLTLKQHRARIPDGPYIYSEWSQIPDDQEDYPRWCRYLNLYKPMVQDETIVYMELRDADIIRSPISDKVYISLFTGHEEYIAAFNMTDTPYTLELRDQWQDRVGGSCGKRFTIPPKRLLFLKRIEDSEEV